MEQEAHPDFIAAKARYEKSKEIAKILIGYSYMDANEILGNAKTHLSQLAVIIDGDIK